MKHKHAEVIKAWADGIEVQYRHFITNHEWSDVKDGDQPNFFGSAEWRIKPLSPEYPESTISDMALHEAWRKAQEGWPTINQWVFDGKLAKACANAALAHALETGALVLPETIAELELKLKKANVRADQAEQAAQQKYFNYYSQAQAMSQQGPRGFGCYPAY
jgi:hypothetical protein